MGKPKKSRQGQSEERGGFKINNGDVEKRKKKQKTGNNRDKVAMAGKAVITLKDGGREENPRVQNVDECKETRGNEVDTTLERIERLQTEKKQLSEENNRMIEALKALDSIGVLTHI